MFFVLIIVISFIATDIWHDQTALNSEKKVCINQVVGIMSFPPQLCSATCRCECWQNHRLSGLSPAFSSTCYILLSPEGNQPPVASRLPLAKCILESQLCSERIWPASSPAVGKRMSLAASGLATTKWMEDLPTLGMLKTSNNPIIMRLTIYQMVQDFFSIHSIFWY